MSSYSQTKENRKPPQYHLKCLQINLHHSKLAFLSLAHVVLDFDIDIVMIQKPYAYSATLPVVANIPHG
jgi:hypothetical protein